MNEFESKSKPRRAQGGKGLLSHQISVQKSQQSIPQIPREEREEERREGWRTGEKELLLWAPGKRERGGGERYLSPTNSRLKD